jgi:acyl-CoA thioesterase-1
MRRPWLRRLVLLAPGLRLPAAALCALLVLQPLACAAQAAPPGVTVVVLGDSLSAEYGLPRDTGWVKLLADRLRDQSPAADRRRQYSVVNASISGETTSGGRARLPEILRQHHPAIVIIELGANDGLRGLSPEAMRANLQAMIDACRQAGARVLLVGIHVPPNYGRDYDRRFYDTFRDVARRNAVAWAPFLLDGFADRLDLFQSDRIHPTVAAQPLMLDNVWPYLKPMLAAAPARSAAAPGGSR